MQNFYITREQLNEESKKLEIKILVTDKQINIVYAIEKDLENKEQDRTNKEDFEAINKNKIENDIKEFEDDAFIF